MPDKIPMSIIKDTDWRDDLIAVEHEKVKMLNRIWLTLCLMSGILFSVAVALYSINDKG